MNSSTITTPVARAKLDEKTAALRIAVIIPCYNEAASIAVVVRGFQVSLPTATIYVYDNNSQDDTIARATEAGAMVRSESRQGKGHVVRRMFADIEADIYVIIDGDNTYDASVADKLVAMLIAENLDMINGARVEQENSAYRLGHKFGNHVLSGLVQIIFGNEFTDMLSGYRVFSRRFVKSFPQSSGGFEIETELTIHALELQMPTKEISVAFKERVEGSESKLNTMSDGLRILLTIFRLLRLERPFFTFGLIGSILLLLALIAAYPIFVTFVETGSCSTIPYCNTGDWYDYTWFLSITAGFILDAITRGRKEAKRMRYLAIPSTLSLLSMRVKESLAGEGEKTP